MTSRLRTWSLAVLAGGVLAIVAAPIVEANTPQPPLHIGNMWTAPEYSSAEGWGNSSVGYPAAILEERDPWTTANSLKRGWIGHSQKQGTYLFTTDWTDPDGIEHPFASSYFFRSMNYAFPTEWVPGTADDAFQYMYSGMVQCYNRWDRPEIYVDGVQPQFHPGTDSLTVLPNHSGDGGYPFDITDPNLVSERVIHMWWRYIQGVRMDRWQYAYSFGSPHQDYVLEDMVLVNDGIMGNEYPGSNPPDPLTNQTITGMIWATAFDHRNAQAGGVRVGQDNHAMYVEPFGAGGHNFVMFWDGDSDGLGVPGAEDGPDYGDPPISEWYEGHLLGNAFVFKGPVFVSEGPDAYDTNLPAQPSMRMIWGERALDFAGAGYSPTSAEDQRAFLADGANQMDIDVEAREDLRVAEFMDAGTGPTGIQGYGPLHGDIEDWENFDKHGWTLGPGETVRIVNVLGAGGLERETARELGNNWIDRRDAGTTPRQTDVEIALILSGADTAYKAMNMAYWNFWGEFAPNVTADSLASWGIAGHVMAKPDGRGEFNVPDAPRPPANFSARARTEGGGVELRWSTEAETEGNFDTRVNDFSHYRVYRQEGSRNAPFEVLSDAKAYWLQEVPADDNVPFAGRVLIDGTTTAGVDYWYAVVAVNDGSQNWAQPDVALESTRWWTWTGYLEEGVAPAAYDPPASIDGVPAKFALSQNSPNPFNPATTINFELAQAGDASLVIYGPTGQVVRTLVSGSLDQGTHSVMWDGMDNMGRAVSSGVYIYRLVSNDNVAQRRMVLVR